MYWISTPLLFSQMNGCSARQLLIAVVKSKLIRDSDLVSFHRAQIMRFSLMGQGLCAPSCGYSSSSCLPLTLTHVYTFFFNLTESNTCWRCQSETGKNTPSSSHPHGAAWDIHSEICSLKHLIISDFAPVVLILDSLESYIYNNDMVFDFSHDHSVLCKVHAGNTLI